MKTKPILIALGILIILGGAFFFIKSKYFAKPEKNEITQFLISFNNQLKSGNTNSVISYFETGQKTKIFKRLISILAGKTGINGKSAALFKLNLDANSIDVKILNADYASAKVPEQLTHDSVAPKVSVLTFKIHKIAAHQFKISQVNANQFVADYVAYENLVKSKTLTDKDIYSSITLQAFETARQLKPRYDSVVWFAHMDKRNFFYVVKGKWDLGQDLYHYKDTVVEPYKMGLVNPDLKEIIPPEYDLIHNISGTFPGLVEVEKAAKKGFYDLGGKIVIPVNYDQIFPIEDEINLAVLRNGDDFFYLKKDMSISEKVDLKISDFFSRISNLANPLNLYTNALSVITEYNSRDLHGAIYIPPSYLVDLNMIGKAEDFKNPLRKIEFDEVHENYKINFSSESGDSDNWLSVSFYSIRDYFLGGRAEFYDKKNLVLVDKRKNRIFTQEIGTDYSGEEGSEVIQGRCDVNNIKAINDSLFEVKAGASLETDLYDSTKTIVGGTYYHYLSVKNNKLVELPDKRVFGFTKYIKMDDSYLNGCYNLLIGGGRYNDRQKKTLDRLTPEILRYIKNEIYADYNYQFKDKRWQTVFATQQRYDENGNIKPGNASVEDSLTDIDKYNISFINQKLKDIGTRKLAAR